MCISRCRKNEQQTNRQHHVCVYPLSLSVTTNYMHFSLRLRPTCISLSPPPPPPLGVQAATGPVERFAEMIYLGYPILLLLALFGVRV